MPEPALRVCILGCRYPPDFGGWGVQLERLLPHLAQLGIEVRVVTRRPEARVAWPARDAGRVERLLPAPDERLARLRGAALLFHHLRRHRGHYDVLHAGFPDWEFLLNLPYVRHIGLPVLHEMVILGGDDPLAIRAGRLGGLKLQLMQHIDAWIGISLAFRPRVLEAGIPAERFHCIYPGVEMDRYRPAEPERRRELRAALDIPVDARVVISVGALLPRKGMDRLLRAWARTAPRPQRDLLLLVGPASEPEGLRPQYLPHVRELEAMAATPELDGTVRIVGRVDTVEDYMAASDVFALLSHAEGFGIVIAEAMACGIPCLVSPLDGIAREIIDEGRTGFVIDDPDDPDAVAAKLNLLLSGSEVRRELGAQAAHTAQERFSMESRAARLLDLYRELRRSTAS